MNATTCTDSRPAHTEVVVHAARTLVAVTSPPIADGAVAVADGRIVAVGHRRRLVEEFPGAETTAWDGMLLPGLVNAHTHLQYTAFDAVGSRHHTDYLAWSDAFVAEYERRRHDDWALAARDGVRRALATGTTCIADVVTDLEARDTLADADVAGVAYLEVLGVDLDVWEREGRARLVAALDDASTTTASRVGISPHTPYTVDEPALLAVAQLARARGLRLHVHLGEVDSEEQLYRTGTGPLAERMRRIVPPTWRLYADAGSGLGIAGYARRCGLLGPDSHIAHGVHLGADDRAILRDLGTSVALCPRSNAVVGVDAPPVAALLADGVDIAVGTDSLASSPSLDLMEDLAELHRLARRQGYRGDDLADRLLRAATIDGARALGLADLVGALEPGLRADMAVFAIEPGDDPVEAIVTAGGGRCVAAITAGVVRGD